MATFVDISPGPVADYFLSALRSIPRKKLNQLAARNLVRPNMSFPTLTYFSIRHEGLEAYVNATHLPLCYFFFGTDSPPTPRYTPYDRFVITQLNAMSTIELSLFMENVTAFFPNPLFDLDEPNYRQRACAVMKHILPDIKPGEEVIVAPYKHLDAQTLQEQIQKYENRNLAWIKLDTLIDLSTYLGVSLHWMLNVKEHPLFCNTVLADQIFSYYTLLSPRQKKQFIILLWNCINVEFMHDYIDCEGWLL